MRLDSFYRWSFSIFPEAKRTTKGSLRSGTEVDRISNLPVHITDEILSKLSLRDAARTSVLSSRWRYRWVTIPDLVFDDQSILVSSPDQISLKNKIVNIVDHVLCLRFTVPIRKFKLSHRGLQAVNEIDRWIYHLSRGSLSELVLEIWRGDCYELPSSIYSFGKLIHLELFNCLLKPPPTVYAFKSLKSLDLQHITMEKDVFDHLISHCPLLERLTLINFNGFTIVDIYAPNLQFCDMGGVFDEVNFRNNFCLASVSIAFFGNVGFDQNMTLGKTGNLIKFFSQLPAIQRLQIQSNFLKYLAVGKIPGKLPVPCMELTYLSIRINFNDLNENLAALCILRSSPNLHELEILGRTEQHTVPATVPNIWEEHYCSCPFNHLRRLKILDICGVRRELDFINFVLANSPMIESTGFQLASDDVGLGFLKELLRSRTGRIYIEP